MLELSVHVYSLELPSQRNSLPFFQLIDQLIIQRGRYEMLMMAYEIEARGHRDTHKLVTVASMLLKRHLNAFTDRMVSSCTSCAKVILDNTGIHISLVHAPGHLKIQLSSYQFCMKIHI